MNCELLDILSLSDRDFHMDLPWSPRQTIKELKEHKGRHHEFLFVVVDALRVDGSHASQDHQEHSHQEATDHDDRATPSGIDIEPSEDNTKHTNDVGNDVKQERTIAVTLRLIEDDAVLGWERLACDLLAKHGQDGNASPNLMTLSVFPTVLDMGSVLTRLFLSNTSPQVPFSS